MLTIATILILGSTIGLKLLSLTERQRPGVRSANLLRGGDSLSPVGGDAKARFAGYAMARKRGWLSVNDIRRMENLNPIPEGGDEIDGPLTEVERGKIRAYSIAAALLTSPLLPVREDNAGRNTYVITYPEHLTNEARAHLSKLWRDIFPGPSAPRCIVLDGGASIKMLPEESPSPDLTHQGDLPSSKRA